MGSQYRDRNYSPGDFVHFTVRGFERRAVFPEPADQYEFMETLRYLLDESPQPIGPSLLAYGQMPNHQHVGLQIGRDPKAATRLMHSLSTRYAISYNWRHQRSGKVFEKSFRGRVVRGAEHIMNTFAYIHLNPDATIRMENSSHGFYAGQRDDPHIDPTLAWRVFGGRAGYLEFFNDTARIRAARQAARRRLTM